MKLKDLKIGTQLKFGFASLLILVVILASVAYFQTDQIQNQAETIYAHPFVVKDALNKIRVDIRRMQLASRDLVLALDDSEKQKAISNQDVAAADVPIQFAVIRSQYLGPKQNVEDAYESFVKWQRLQENINFTARHGDVESLKGTFSPGSEVAIQGQELINKFTILDDFANNKANELIKNSQDLSDSLNRRLLLIASIILLLAIGINYLLIRNISRPILELSDASLKFHEGDMNARSSYTSANEFGNMSKSFNNMVEGIQRNAMLRQNAASLAEVMMANVNASEFFQATLASLASITNAQMATVYLQSDDRKFFECFESIGVNKKLKSTFEAGIGSGEFGLVLAEKRIIHLKQIPEENGLHFSTVSGDFRPLEIITIPILELGNVVAIVSLASLYRFSELSVRLIHDIHPVLISRINGVLMFKKMKDFSEMLDRQNKELEQQSMELAMQADELKESNVELELQKRQLDEANQLKSAFLSNMSHELRTPLNSVIALSGVLNRKLRTKISEEEFSYLGIIEKNGKQLLSMINDILDLSRIEAGKEEVFNRVFPIQTLISSIVETLLPIANEKQIDLINMVPEELPLLISDDRKCLHILQNIIGNAVKFTDKGSVEITAELRNEIFVVNVTDTGIGISLDEIPYIFDEFRQVDDRSSRKYGGTGLGLAIAKKYVNMLQGNIEVRSNPGAGSTFVITIPQKPVGYDYADNEQGFVQYKSSVHSVVSSAFPAGKSKTLLLVEDSEPQIIQLNDILTEEGYVVQIARNGREALEAIRISVPDAMILDLMMPEVDGFEVLRLIREQEITSRIPVLILSAKHITKSELSFLKSNHIFQLIQKGDVNRSELLTYVSEMVQFQHKIVAEKQFVKTALPGNGLPVILIIEDNLDNIETVKALIGDKYQIEVSTDGFSGWEKVKSTQPALVLLDISISGVDGITLLQDLKSDENLKKIPVIAFTARAMKGDREELLAYGFDDYIAKPIDNNLFDDMLSGWIEKRNS